MLNFPLERDDELAIRNTIFLAGEVTLSSGSATVISPRIRQSSVGMVTRKTSGGTIGHLSIQCSNGVATISSSSTSDTSRVYYLIYL